MLSLYDFETFDAFCLILLHRIKVYRFSKKHLQLGAVIVYFFIIVENYKMMSKF